MILYVICPSVRLRNWLPRDLRNSRRMRETLGANPDLGSGWCVSAISRGGDGFEFLFCDFMGFTSWNFFPNLQFWSADMEYLCNFLLCAGVDRLYPFIKHFHMYSTIVGGVILWKNAFYDLSKKMQDGYGGDTKFHPWRYPGKAPVKDACGVTAGGTAPLGQLDPPPGETTGAAGKTLPPLLEETVWIAGSEVEAKKGIERCWMMLNGRQIDTNWQKNSTWPERSSEWYHNMVIDSSQEWFLVIIIHIPTYFEWIFQMHQKLQKGRLGHCCKSWWWLPVSPLSCWRRSNWRMFSKNSFGLCWWRFLAFPTFHIWPILTHHFMNFTWVMLLQIHNVMWVFCREFAMYECMGSFVWSSQKFWGSMAAVWQRIWSFNSHYYKGSSTDWWDSWWQMFLLFTKLLLFLMV